MTNEIQRSSIEDTNPYALDAQIPTSGYNLEERNTIYGGAIRGALISLAGICAITIPPLIEEHQTGRPIGLYAGIIGVTALLGGILGATIGGHRGRRQANQSSQARGAGVDPDGRRTLNVFSSSWPSIDDLRNSD